MSAAFKLLPYKDMTTAELAKITTCLINVSSNPLGTQDHEAHSQALTKAVRELDATRCRGFSKLLPVVLPSHDSTLPQEDLECQDQMGLQEATEEHSFHNN